MTARDHKAGVWAALSAFEQRQASKPQWQRDDERREAQRHYAPKRPKRAVPTEYQEQGRLCAWLRAAGIDHHSVPNEAAGRPDYKRIAMARHIGMSKGAPDLVIVDLAPADGRPVVIEMKRAEGGVLSEAQRYWQARYTAAGWHYILAHGCDDAVRQLEALGYGKA